jgi:hypothetical protein
MLVYAKVDLNQKLILVNVEMFVNNLIKSALTKNIHSKNKWVLLLNSLTISGKGDSVQVSESLL